MIYTIMHVMNFTTLSSCAKVDSITYTITLDANVYYKHLHNYGYVNITTLTLTETPSVVVELLTNVCKSIDTVKKALTYMLRRISVGDVTN